MAGKFFLVDFVAVAVLRAQSILGLDFLESHQCPVNSIYSPARRIPPFQMKEVQKLLQDIERRDVNQPASSPRASPVVLLVRKKVGSLWLCIDICNLNGITCKDAYPAHSLNQRHTGHSCRLH